MGWGLLVLVLVLVLVLEAWSSLALGCRLAASPNSGTGELGGRVEWTGGTDWDLTWLPWLAFGIMEVWKFWSKLIVLPVMKSGGSSRSVLLLWLFTS